MILLFFPVFSKRERKTFFFFYELILRGFLGPTGESHEFLRLDLFVGRICTFCVHVFLVWWRVSIWA